jgi:hypothetical protein
MRKHARLLASGADACGRFDSPARANHGRPGGRPERFDDGYPLRDLPLLLGDFLILRLLELTGQKREDMYTRYTNLK